MAEKLSLAFELVNHVLGALNEARSNREECQCLERVAKLTLETVSKIQRKSVTDESLSEALGYMNEALRRTHTAIDDYRNSNWVGALLPFSTHSSALKKAVNDINCALVQMSLAAFETTLDMQSQLSTNADGTSHEGFGEPGSLEDVDGQDNEGQTPLCTASLESRIETVRELIAKGAKVDRPNKKGESPLFIASANGHIHIVKELVASGANSNLPATAGMSPLYIASENGHMAVVEELIEHYAKVNLQSNNGSTPLHAASFEGHVDIVKKLLANGSNVDTQMKDGWSSLLIASQKGHMDVVKELIDKGSNVNLSNTSGTCPLYIAAQKGHIDVVKELISKDSNVNSQTNDGFTPLYVASEKGHTDIELITNKAKVDLPTNNGDTPLHTAASCGRIDVVQVLLNHGVSKKARNNNSKKPLDILCSNQDYGPYEDVTIKRLKSLLKR